MKIIILSIALIISSPLFAAPQKSMICHDVEFGAGHLKIIIQDMKGFFTPREQKPMVQGEFWMKGERFIGVFEQSMFMPDWNGNSGWYRSNPSPLDFSLCNWKKCPIRKIKLMVHTKDQLKAEGNIKFLIQTSDKERQRFDRKLNCEIK
ncbi:MAG: hypothetical protein H0V66_16220 [Bdellovibrionales bacterium]|nr:hypothetical protein [Bdellovibrionales bacterium]